MKHYTLDVTITDEDENKQIIQLRAPHLTGLEVKQITDMACSGILLEPTPPVIVVEHKPEKKRHGLFKNMNNNHYKSIKYPVVPTTEDIKDI